MKERPILFKGAMVRAILEDRKKQTRRIAKIESLKIEPTSTILSLSCRFSKPHKKSLSVFTGTTWTHRQAQEWLGRNYSPYGQPGDRLWVRETWNKFADPDGLAFAATDNAPELSQWKPSIHMPRSASRIDLEIVSVRVERLQDITEGDAAAEGVEYDSGWEEEPGFGWLDYLSVNDSYSMLTAKDSYRSLWESINGPGSWDANPYVWVVEFKRFKP